MNAARHEAIERLRQTHSEMLPLFDSSPALLAKPYATGKWTFRQVLIHLSDTETVLLDRLRRLASEPNPTLMAFDQDLWAAGLFYDKRDLALARLQFDVARKSVLEL